MIYRILNAVRNKKYFIFILLILISPLYAWDSHFLLTYAALKDMPEIRQSSTVTAESLESFLQKEKNGLVNLLRENEKWALVNVPLYPPLPANLVFTGKNDSKSLQLQFLEAIRVNPTLRYPLFIQYRPEQAVVHPLAPKNVMLKEVEQFPWIRANYIRLGSIQEEDKVFPLDIISTAADEPDYGMDLNLWEDNDSWFGKLYKLGLQPFGQGAWLSIGQVVFHTAYYYEPFIYYWAAPSFKRAYVEYRLHLFLGLSQYAFQTGHLYWGYRFLGWALHYAQDLTQPYHSKAFPGVSTVKPLIFYLVKQLGYSSLHENNWIVLGNHHLALEGYQYELIKEEIEKKDNNELLIRALSDSKHDTHYPAFNDSYLKQIVAKESYAKADSIAKVLTDTFPRKYISNPHYIFYKTDPNVSILLMAKSFPEGKTKQLNTELEELLRNFGSHTRNIVKYGIHFKK